MGSLFACLVILYDSLYCLLIFLYNNFDEYLQSVKRFGSISDLTSSQARSRSKLFAWLSADHETRH